MSEIFLLISYYLSILETKDAAPMQHLDYILEDIRANPSEVIAIVGPTCTGKTDLSIALAQMLDIPIINADSRLIFDEMNIGTAKPKPEELNSATHHLVNIKKPNENYSAGEYRDDFDNIMQNSITQLEANKPRAIVVGGTGLYLRSALENLEMPDISRDHQLRKQLNNQSLEALVAELNRLDPEAHQQVDIKNKVRVIRALEIVKLSGKPLADNRSRNSENRYKARFYGLNYHKRRTLYDLINRRVINMVRRGLVHEVEDLVKRYGPTEVLQGTIGYKEIIGYLNKEYSLSQATRMIQKKTRQYAKRQLTWFKSNRDIHWLYND